MYVFCCFDLNSFDSDYKKFFQYFVNLIQFRLYLSLGQVSQVFPSVDIGNTYAIRESRASRGAWHAPLFRRPLSLFSDSYAHLYDSLSPSCTGTVPEAAGAILAGGREEKDEELRLVVGVVSPRVGHVVKHVVRVEVEPLCNLLQPLSLSLLLLSLSLSLARARAPSFSLSLSRERLLSFSLSLSRECLRSLSLARASAFFLSLSRAARAPSFSLSLSLSLSLFFSSQPTGTA